MTLIDCLFVGTALLGAAAIVLRQRATFRRWVINIYSLLIAFLAVTVVMDGTRLADKIDTTGTAYFSDIAKGEHAMYNGLMPFGGTVLVIAIVLAVLALRPPK